MYSEWIDELCHADTASQRSNLVKEFARLHGLSLPTAYRTLEAAGWDSGRKKRRDAGSSAINQDTVSLIAAMLKSGVRKNGKKTMHANVARTILQQNGYDIPVSDSTIRRALRKAKLDIASMSQAAPYQRQRTEYPNQVHECDPSLALIYFTPGQQHLLRDDEVYKNKPFLEGREKLKCWRYVLTDHYSSSICVRYYATAGESAAVLWDFLLYAWAPKPDPIYAFHGLPDLLIWDPGSANKSRAITQALKSLKVDTKPHLPGNPRAKGQVEKANDIVETQFESRLRLEEVHSLDELNDAAERWCTAWNADMIDGQDCRLTRMNRKIGSRLSIWQRIKEKQLRELPDPEICRLLLTTGVETRKVAGGMSMSYAHPSKKYSQQYSLQSCPGLIIGQDVNVQPVLVGGGSSLLISYKSKGEILTFEVDPIETDEVGFDLSAPVIGKEYKRLPETEIEQHAKILDEIAPEKQGFVAHSFIKPRTDIAPKRKIGVQVPVGMADVVTSQDIYLSPIETAKRIKARLGYVPEGFVPAIKRDYPDGVPASLIDDIAHDYEEGGEDTALSV
ncbi:DDE-type integrase/transposase/recombinase [Sediminispirochaeta bajacaliforniensis]|uniref:DDE-type integrase/transposase/recombinase n=1 Tax=Sediminispirochaeta bajacaliforniensis TaxID=148 RepID=UPI00036A10B9|nr:DDE-type integrase/transposase/recombinase [Sediminispirochaeta bajacaliforniensis]